MTIAFQSLASSTAPPAPPNARASLVGVSFWVAAVLTAAVIVFPHSAALAQSDSGLEIMKKQRTLHHLDDEHTLVRMRLLNSEGKEKRRTLSIDTLTTSGDLHKVLLRFLAPADIANTGLLVWESSRGEDDQWLYLPASRKVKRIPASGKKNSFMGTDFAYEDMRPEMLDLHAYTLVRSEIVDGRDAFVIEARPATSEHAPNTGYGLRALWIQKDSYVILKIQYYDRTGGLLKVLTPRQYVNVHGTAQRANEIEMHDVQAGTRTIMTVDRRTVNSGLKESFFTEFELTRGGS